MTADIGFGLIDRRTVIVVLFSMIIAQALWNLQIPLDTSNVGRLFVDLVLLTGYLYLSRSIYRFPVAFIASLFMMGEILRGISSLTHELLESLNSQTDKSIFTALKKLGALFLLYVGAPIGAVFALPLLIFSFGQWIEVRSKRGDYDGWGTRLLAMFLGTLDRAGVIAIAVLATVPNFRFVVNAIGIAGLIGMVVVFTIRGDFTALVRDILEKKEHDKGEEPMPVEIKNYRPIDVRVVKDISYD